MSLAARHRGEAKDGQILVSRRVAVAAADVAEIRSIGDLTLKGFRDPVPAFEISTLAPRIEPADTHLSRGERG